MNIQVALGLHSYPIILERGALNRVGHFADFNRKVMIVTDDGVPCEYARTVAEACKFSHIYTVTAGECSKSVHMLEKILKKMLALGFDRGDCVVAVGGGVVGDLGGFVAATYMRGIDFYNIPTTTLSQIDSSIGGKVAVNLDGAKNIVGAFHQPKCVIVDADTLYTLSHRHYINGLFEGLKAGLIADETLYRVFLQDDFLGHTDEIIYRSLMVKKAIVEQDEKEANLRKLLNFGHTIGHGIESSLGLGGLYHGECIALGMLPMLTDCAIREQTKKILTKMEINPYQTFDSAAILPWILKDKKIAGDRITVVLVDVVGKGYLKEITLDELKQILA